MARTPEERKALLRETLKNADCQYNRFALANSNNYWGDLALSAISIRPEFKQGLWDALLGSSSLEDAVQRLYDYAMSVRPDNCD